MPLQLNWVDNHIGEMIGIWRQPGSNTLQLVEQIKAMLPQLQAGIPPSIKLSVVSDRSLSISASFTDVQRTLGFTIVLVILVIFIFLRSFWATVIPSLTVPLSLVGTFAVLYIGGYSLDNLSLMALTLAVGLVVDDAIVMLENIFRYLEQGDDRLTAALKGAGEIGFTIVSITVSLIAVFIPILFMGGIVGRLFREFGVTVSVAIVLSALIALSLSPSLAALVLKDPRAVQHGRFYQWSERVWERVLHGYEYSLKRALRLRALLMLLNLALIAATFWMLMAIPKGFFPTEDTGMIYGFTQASPDISFMGMADAQQRAAAVVLQDPDVISAGSAIGGNGSSGLNTGRMFISLKPWSERKASQAEIIQRLRPQLAQVPGITTFLQSVETIRIGGRLSRTQYQYTLQDTNMQELYEWAPKVEEKLKAVAGLQDVASDLQQSSPQLMIQINRDTAARLGVNPSLIESTLYSAFGQRFVTQIYGTLNTYHIVMEVAPAYQEDVSALSRIYVHGSGGQLIPVSQFAQLAPQVTTLSVNHQGQFPRRHAVVQPGARHLARRGARPHPAGDTGDRDAGYRGDLVPRHRAGLPELAVDAALPDHDRDFRGLCRARHPLRELHPSGDDPDEPAAGERRRPGIFMAVRLRPQRHRDYRSADADRHRQEERDHDDRFRARTPASRGEIRRRGDL